MNHGSLTPTPTIDRNGKATTVYRRAGSAPSRSISALAGARPAVAGGGSHAPAGRLDRTTVTVTFDVKYGREDRLSQRFAEVAPGVPLALPDKGVPMSGAEAYTYLTMGVSLEDAALLHLAAPDSAAWTSDPTAQEWAREHLRAVQQGGVNGDRVDEAVAVMRSHGVPPKKVHQMIENGFSNTHLRGVLDNDQLVQLLGRLRYERSTVPGKTARGAHMMNQFLDGTLPFTLIERGYHKRFLTEIAHSLVPVKGKFPIGGDPVRSISAEDAAAILADLDQLLGIADVMQEHEIKDPAAAWHAIRLYGKDEALACPPGAILGRTSEGRLVGPDGWRRVRDFMSDHLAAGGYGSGAARRSYDRYSVPSDAYGGRIYEVREILDVLNAGRGTEETVNLLRSGLTGPQLAAVVNGSTAQPLAAGWL